MAAILRSGLAGGLRMVLNGYGLRPQYQARSFCKVPPDDAKPADVIESLTEKKQEQTGEKPVTTHRIEKTVSEEKLLTNKKSEESFTEEKLQTTQKNSEACIEGKDDPPTHSIVSGQVAEGHLSEEKHEITQTVKEPLIGDKHDQSERLVNDQKVKEPLIGDKHDQSERLVNDQKVKEVPIAEKQGQFLDNIETAQEVDAFSKEEKVTVQKSDIFLTENKQDQSDESLSAQKATEISADKNQELSVDRMVTSQRVEGSVTNEEQKTAQKVEGFVLKEEQETIQKVEGLVAKEEQQTVQVFEDYATKQEQKASQKLEKFVTKELEETSKKIENVIAKEELETVQKDEGQVAKEEEDTVRKVERLVKEEQDTGLKVDVTLTEDRHDQSDKVVTAQNVEETNTDIKHMESLDKMITVQEVEGLFTEEQKCIQKAEAFITKMEDETGDKVEAFVAEEKQETAQKVEEAFTEKKHKVEDKKVVAQKKLHNLLTSLATADFIPVEPVVKLSRPKARPKKKAKSDPDGKATPMPSEKLIEPELLSATEEVAESLGGDVEGTKSELLSALSSHSPDKNDKSAVNLSELFVGMKVEKSQSKPVKEYPRPRRFEQGLETSPRSFRGDDQQRRVWSKTSSKPLPRTLARVDLFGAEPLGIFTTKSSESNKDAVVATSLLPVWEAALRREKQLCVTHPPDNAFNEMIQWTNQGKLWTFPVDNEFGLEEEKKIGFHEHVFLERHLEGWCPKRGPIRHFMELVCTGLSKNPYLTVQRKHAHIEWYKNYFAEKEDLLREIGAIESLK